MSFAFVPGLMLIATMWMKDNTPRKIDFAWLKEGGGTVACRRDREGSLIEPAGYGYPRPSEFRLNPRIQ